MQVWFTAQQTADRWKDLGLTSLPLTKRGVNDLIDRENWRSRAALCRTAAGIEGGGGWQYHLEQWQLFARIAHVVRDFRLTAADMILPPSDDGGLSERARMTRDARLIVVRAADAFRRHCGLGAHAADRYFAQLFKGGSYDLSKWLEDSRDEVPEQTARLLAWAMENVDTLSARTIARYRAAAITDTARLATDPADARKGTGLLDTANHGKVRHFVLGLLAEKSHLTAMDIQIQCRAEFGEELADRHGELRQMPPERTFRHFIAKLKTEEKVALTRMRNPDKYRSHYALTGDGAFAWVKEPNQLWQIDASPIDVLCVDGRHSIYLCLDLATRRVVITMSKTPRASAVGLMIRKAIMAWGVAERIKTDNGSDFVAKETNRLFAALGIEIERSHAFTPQEKGHVERAIKTFQHGFCPKLPGYIGHDVADRKEIESRRAFARRLGCDDADAFAVELTAAEVQHRIDEWVEYDYSAKPHSGLDGLSPAQAAERSIHPIRRVNEHALDVLLMPIAGNGGIRVMGKKGLSLGFRGHFHQAPEIMPGTKVFVRMDPMDAGRARVFTPDADIFLADAVCAELLGLDPVAYLKAARAEREARITRTTRPARDAVRHLSGSEIIDRHLEVRKRDAAARAAGNSNVIRLPKREETHTTPQIEAAAESNLPMPVAPQAPRAAEIQRQLLVDINAPALRQRPAVPVSEVDEGYERFRRALRLEEIEAGGQLLAVEDARWLAGYRMGPEYSAMRLMRERFGEAMGF